MVDEMRVPVAEIFPSIQGEGKSVGKPSIFVRLWGCNLRCRFKGQNCDTPYAVITEKDKSVRMTMPEVIVKIREYKPLEHIVWTGGEPMLYQDFIAQTMRILYPEGYTSEMETNGTIACSPLTKVAIDQFNISVKLASSNQEPGYDSKRINYPAISSFPVAKSNFKFVITSIDDIAEVLTIHRYHQFKDIPVYLMPQGMTRDEIIANAPYVVDVCVKNNFMYSPREHITIWDKKRGV
jgi:organic radical activating enzyme